MSFFLKKTDYTYVKSNEDDIIAINVFYYILVCGITTHDPQKMRNDEFLRSIMQNVNEKVHEEEKEGLLEECDEDPFFNM